MSTDVWTSTEQGNLALIQAVKKHPCLYNNTLPEYSQKDVTSAAWQEIAEQFGCSALACKRKWNHFRSYFSRELKTKHKKKPYFYSKPLSFLLPHYKQYSKYDSLVRKLKEESKEAILGLPYITDNNDSTCDEPLEEPHSNLSDKPLEEPHSNLSDKPLEEPQIQIERVYASLKPIKKKIQEIKVLENKEHFPGLSSVTNNNDLTLYNPLGKPPVLINGVNSFCNLPINNNLPTTGNYCPGLSCVTNNNDLTLYNPLGKPPVQINEVNSFCNLPINSNLPTTVNYCLLQVPQLFVIQSAATEKIPEQKSCNDSSYSFVKTPQIAESSVSQVNDSNNLTLEPTIIQCKKAIDNEYISHDETYKDGNIIHKAKDKEDVDHEKSYIVDLKSRRQFILSLLPEVNLMTETQFFRFKRKIFELIDSLSES